MVEYSLITACWQSLCHFHFNELVYLLFGVNHWLCKEIDRLTKIRNRTKNKRIKKKLEKRMFIEIFKEWKRSCKSTHH